MVTLSFCLCGAALAVFGTWLDSLFIMVLGGLLLLWAIAVSTKELENLRRWSEALLSIEDRMEHAVNTMQAMVEAYEMRGR